MNFLEYLLFLILENIIPLLPIGFWRFIAKIKGTIFYYTVPVRKKTARENLTLAFPEKSKADINRIIKSCYINVLTVIAEFFYMRKWNIDKLAKEMKVTNPELISGALAKGKGLILISAHFGNWELTAYGVSRICGNPFNVIVKEQSNKKIDERINRIRTSAGNKMIYMRSALRDVLTALKNNEITAMLGDQAAPKENVRIKFFINNVPTFEGAARFALKTGAALVFGVSVRNPDGTYTVTLHQIDTAKYSDSGEESIREVTQEHANLLIDYIKEHPGHWLWFHKRFKNVPSPPTPLPKGEGSM